MQDPANGLALHAGSDRLTGDVYPWWVEEESPVIDPDAAPAPASAFRAADTATPPSAGPDTGGSAVLAGRELPSWPFTLIFGLYPLIWAAGLSALALPIVGALCLALLVLRGRTRLPKLWLLWTAFLVWSLTSVVMVDTFGRLAGFAQRWTATAGAVLLAVYLVNARASLPRERVLKQLTVFFAWVVAGGWLGMISPWTRLDTPVLRLFTVLFPPSIAQNPYVVELLSPRFAEVQKPYGVSVPFVRPAAPFPYTNSWGCAYVLLLPVVLALFLRSGRGMRLVLAALVAASLPPALATLNRGVFIGVGVAGGYLGLRLARRVTLARVLQVGALVGLVTVAVLTAGGGSLGRLAQRTASGASTTTRLQVYEETFQRTLDSPLLGQGAPRPSETSTVAVGTQGQVWYVMFSYGFVGLALFLLAFWGMGLATWRVASVEALLLHTPLVVASVMITFYGLDGTHLALVLTCFVLLVRGERRTATPVPRPVAAPLSTVPPRQAGLEHAARSA